MVQAHPEALKNERVTQVTLFCFWPSEQILVINIGYFKRDIIGYQSLHGILSGGVIEENSEQFIIGYSLNLLFMVICVPYAAMPNKVWTVGVVRMFGVNPWPRSAACFNDTLKQFIVRINQDKTDGRSCVRPTSIRLVISMTIVYFSSSHKSQTELRLARSPFSSGSVITGGPCSPFCDTAFCMMLLLALMKTISVSGF